MKKFIKKNRNLLLIIGLIIIITNSSSKLEATVTPELIKTCDTIGSLGIHPATEEKNECYRQGCHIEFIKGLPFSTWKCIACIETGHYTYGGANACCSGEAIKATEPWLGIGEVLYKCMPSEETCFGAKQQIAKFVQSFWKDASCTNAFYVGIGIIAIFGVLIISVI